jgi:hypothetical protein
VRPFDQCEMPLHVTEEEKAPKRVVVSSNTTEETKKKHNKSEVDIDEVTLEIYCKGMIFAIFLISIIIVTIGIIALVKLHKLNFQAGNWNCVNYCWSSSFRKIPKS